MNVCEFEASRGYTKKPYISGGTKDQILSVKMVKMVPPLVAIENVCLSLM